MIDQPGTDMTALNPTQPEPQPDPRPTPQPEPQPASAPQSPQPQEPPTGLRPDPESVPVGRPEPVVLEPLDPTSFTYSVVVPVYNSQGVVGTTVDRIVAEFEQQGLSYEVILVNDGSGDRSWEVISEKAEQNPHVVALNLLRNYGQHNANLAGFREATGRLRHHDGRRPAEPARPDAAAHRRGDAGPRRRVRAVRDQEVSVVPTSRQQADRDDQPAHLRPAQRPGRLQLPHPAP